MQSRETFDGIKDKIARFQSPNGENGNAMLSQLSFYRFRHTRLVSVP